MFFILDTKSSSDDYVPTEIIDDKKRGTIRVHGSIYTIKSIAKWWQFWKIPDTPIASTDFIIRPNGSFIE